MKMMRRWSAVLAGALVSLSLAACDGPRKPVKMPDPTTTVDRAAYDAARAEVTRLRAEAERLPLLAPWQGDHGGVPPWDQVTPAAFGAAFTAGLALRDAELAVITSNPDAPTFANTMVPYEDFGRHQDRAETLFSVLTSNLSTPEAQAVDEEWSPKLAAAVDRVYFDQELFARIAAIHDDPAGLSEEQKRLVELTWRRFVRAGAQLDADGKARLGAINQELATLFTEFSNKLLADEDTWIVLESKKDLAGLPDSLVAAYAAAAEAHGLPGKWAVVNTRSSVDPFLTSSTRRDLREQVWKKFKGRGDNGDDHDTNATIAKIVALRAERAKLLGYASHAHWRMSDTMAVDPAKATELMMKVWPAAVARVGEEVKDMQAIAKKEGAKITIEPWDYLFYAEKVRKARYDLDAAELKPYFELNNMIAASFWMAEKLYGLRFAEITGTVPVFHPDVRVWKVTRGDGALVGLFYGDYFARAGKRSGAWASGYRGHETFTGETILPITSNNNNFVKGAAGAPVLISLDDAETLFHEFGHALHGLLSEVNYPGLAVTPRDFVEFPSQVHEQWVLTAPVLDKFARHYQTGAAMPKALLAKVEASSKFNQGYATVEYLASALVDMELHTRPDGTGDRTSASLRDAARSGEAGPFDPDAFERETMARIGAPKEVAMRHRLPQFGHLFTSDSYSAGYYSYLWSEVMDADTREAFAEAGDLFDPATAEKMRKYILAPGNSTDRAEAYRQFRGRDPEVKALLVKRGFPVP